MKRWDQLEKYKEETTDPEKLAEIEEAIIKCKFALSSYRNKMARTYKTKYGDYNR